MNIKLITIGKIKDKWLREGIEEFQKRLKKYCKLEIIEKADAPDSLPFDKATVQEAEQIKSMLTTKSFCVALDLGGKELSSEDLAMQLPSWFLRGRSQVIFIIGGSRGLHRSVLDLCSARISLSRLTFTHQMARLILLEQIYRSFKINNNENYHK